MKRKSKWVLTQNASYIGFFADSANNSEQLQSENKIHTTIHIYVLSGTIYIKIVLLYFEVREMWVIVLPEIVQHSPTSSIWPLLWCYPSSSTRRPSEPKPYPLFFQGLYTEIKEINKYMCLFNWYNKIQHSLIYYEFLSFLL